MANDGGREAQSCAGSSVVGEQLAYYRARAPEYDRWFYREGRYDRGRQATAAWFREVAHVHQALMALPLEGAEVLELAAGTGLWTQPLAERAARVTAIDAAPEMIGANQARLGALADRVAFCQQDLLQWWPPRRWDVVVFCFWISHVPQRSLDRFLAAVRAALRDGGSVFFLDGRREPNSTASDHRLPDDGEEVMLRRLDDGTEFRIVKNFWDPTELRSRCASAGLDVQVHETPTYFLYGIGHAL